MKERWQALSVRERLWISVSGIIVLFLIFYFLLWAPIYSEVKLTQRQVHNNQALLLWMQEANTLIQQHKNNMPAHVAHHTDPTSRLIVIQQTLKETDFNKSVTTLAQTNHNDVKLQIKNVSFDALSRWLVTLWQTHGIAVNSATLHRQDKIGVVDAELVLGND